MVLVVIRPQRNETQRRLGVGGRDATFSSPGPGRIPPSWPAGKSPGSRFWADFCSAGSLDHECLHETISPVLLAR